MEKLLTRSPCPGWLHLRLSMVAGLRSNRSRLRLSGLVDGGGGLGEPTEISETAGLLQLRTVSGLGVRCGIFSLTSISVNFPIFQIVYTQIFSLRFSLVFFTHF